MDYMNLLVEFSKTIVKYIIIFIDIFYYVILLDCTLYIYTLAYLIYTNLNIKFTVSSSFPGTMFKILLDKYR